MGLSEHSLVHTTMRIISYPPIVNTWFLFSLFTTSLFYEYQGTDMITKLLKMQLLEDDDDEFAYTAPGAEADVGKSADGRPAWMRTLQTSADALLQLLPNSIQVLRRTVENIKDPLYRFFEREVNLGAKLLKEIRQDLNDVIQICMVSLLQRN